MIKIFGSKTCSACKILLTKIPKEIDYEYLLIEDNVEEALKYKIMSLPTTIIIKENATKVYKGLSKELLNEISQISYA